jgi:hypothetical protein
MTKDEAQRRRWTFYEAVNYNSPYLRNSLLPSDTLSVDTQTPLILYFLDPEGILSIQEIFQQCRSSPLVGKPCLRHKTLRLRRLNVLQASRYCYRNFLGK